MIDPKDAYRLLAIQQAHHARGVHDEAAGLAYRIDGLLVGSWGPRRRALNMVRNMCVADADRAGERMDSESFWSRPLWAQSTFLLELAELLDLPTPDSGELTWTSLSALAEQVFGEVRRLATMLYRHGSDA